MTKREARKIATLVAASSLRTSEHWGTARVQGEDDAEKVGQQSARLAQKLAERYGHDARSLPASEEQIVEGVMDGSL